MKSSILLLALTALAFSSCTTAYKTGQTPDDVYYSPVRIQDEYVRTNRDEDQKYRGEEYYDDRYLRMKVHNRTRWSELDDWYYYGRRYNYTVYNSCFCNNPWTPYSYWNNFYNPYYHNYIVINPKSSTVYSAPRRFNLNTYNGGQVVNSKYSNPKNSPGTYNNTYTGPKNTTSSNNDNTGSFLRSIFNGNRNSSSGSSTGSSNNSSSGSPSGSSGSSAPVRKF